MAAAMASPFSLFRSVVPTLSLSLICYYIFYGYLFCRCSRLLRFYGGAKRKSFFPNPSPSLPSQRFTRHISASVDEQASARAAAATADNGGPTIFDKIISKEIPSTIVYEDDNVLAFRDINPQAPVHVLVIPKLRDGLTQLGKAEPRHADILGQLLYASKVVAEKEGIVDNFRVVINNGPDACQSVYHLHLHILGGRQMKWPPG
ncbi:14 kDa zinc-binding protein [Iris pallida]|uniref:14 kDa zinc-binding protein n=1 Tax=Iris pallida TaxID=29817 RepID=A0AAX6GAL6_IRIPA|nr:14 kDa zinc-binding protein [Iris pallida]KAJ6841589.1 14 kDa zinc-binding protein [Iris pallida]